MRLAQREWKKNILSYCKVLICKEVHWYAHQPRRVPNCKHHPSGRWLGSGSSDALCQKEEFPGCCCFPHEFGSSWFYIYSLLLVVKEMFSQHFQGMVGNVELTQIPQYSWISTVSNPVFILFYFLFYFLSYLRWAIDLYFAPFASSAIALPCGLKKILQGKGKGWESCRQDELCY